MNISDIQKTLIKIAPDCIKIGDETLQTNGLPYEQWNEETKSKFTNIISNLGDNAEFDILVSVNASRFAELSHLIALLNIFIPLIELGKIKRVNFTLADTLQRIDYKIQHFTELAEKIYNKIKTNFYNLNLGKQSSHYSELHSKIKEIKACLHPAKTTVELKSKTQINNHFFDSSQAPNVFQSNHREPLLGKIQEILEYINKEDFNIEKGKENTSLKTIKKYLEYFDVYIFAEALRATYAKGQESQLKLLEYINKNYPQRHSSISISRWCDLTGNVYDPQQIEDDIYLILKLRKDFEKCEKEIREILTEEANILQQEYVQFKKQYNHHPQPIISLDKIKEHTRKLLPTPENSHSELKTLLESVTEKRRKNYEQFKNKDCYPEEIWKTGNYIYAVEETVRYFGPMQERNISVAYPGDIYLAIQKGIKICYGSYKLSFFACLFKDPRTEKNDFATRERSSSQNSQKSGDSGYESAPPSNNSSPSSSFTYSSPINPPPTTDPFNPPAPIDPPNPPKKSPPLGRKIFSPPNGGIADPAKLNDDITDFAKTNGGGMADPVESNDNIEAYLESAAKHSYVYAEVPLPRNGMKMQLFFPPASTPTVLGAVYTCAMSAPIPIEKKNSPLQNNQP